MYIETSYPRKPGENAKLVVAIPNNGKPSCLSFYYHMYGASAGTLNVYSDKTKVFTVSGNQGDKWLIVGKTLYLEGAVSATKYLPSDNLFARLFFEKLASFRQLGFIFSKF